MRAGTALAFAALVGVTAGQLPSLKSLSLSPASGSGNIIMYDEEVTVSFTVKDYDGSSENTFLKKQERVNFRLATQETQQDGSKVWVELPCRITAPTCGQVPCQEGIHTKCDCAGQKETFKINFPLVSPAWCPRECRRAACSRHLHSCLCTCDCSVGLPANRIACNQRVSLQCVWDGSLASGRDRWCVLRVRTRCFFPTSPAYFVFPFFFVCFCFFVF